MSYDNPNTQLLRAGRPREHGIIMGELHLLLLESVLFKGSRFGSSTMMPHPHPTSSELWLSYEVSFVSVPEKECSKIEEILEGTGYPTPNLSGRSCWRSIP